MRLSFSALRSLLCASACCCLCAAQAGPQSRSEIERDDTYCFGCPATARIGSQPRPAVELIQLASNHSLSCGKQSKTLIPLKRSNWEEFGAVISRISFLRCVRPHNPRSSLMINPGLRCSPSTGPTCGTRQRVLTDSVLSTASITSWQARISVEVRITCPLLPSFPIRLRA